MHPHATQCPLIAAAVGKPKTRILPNNFSASSQTGWLYYNFVSDIIDGT
jgi:hypothetical protein